MKYKSFEAAKIANPEEDIFKLEDGSFVTGSWIQKSNFGEYTFTLCHAKDYCMPLEEFRDSDKKFIAGDYFLSVSGRVVLIVEDDVSIANRMASVEGQRFVLRAAALEGRAEEEESEKPKRVKVEYVKVEDKQAWTLVKEFEEGVEFYTCSKGLHTSKNIGNLLSVWRNGDLHRRVETEISERDEFIKKVEAIAEDITSDSEWSFACIATAMFDSGEFKLTKGE